MYTQTSMADHLYSQFPLKTIPGKESKKSKKRVFFTPFLGLGKSCVVHKLQYIYFSVIIFPL